MLDMLASFAHVAITQDYVRPELGDYFAVKDGRHALREKIHGDKFVPNDVYATPHYRFTIMTGCNMSGKSNLHSIHCSNVNHGAGRELRSGVLCFPAHPSAVICTRVHGGQHRG